MLSRVCDRHLSSSQESPYYADQYFDPRLLARLTLLTDITTQLNALNVKLQGKYILVTNMHAHITAFEERLRLWEAQLANCRLEPSPCLAACVPDDVEPDTCVASLREEFASRFTGVRTAGCGLQPVYRPLWLSCGRRPCPCRWSWWRYSAMINWRRSSTTLLHCPSSATSPSLLAIVLNTLRMFNAS